MLWKPESVHNGLTTELTDAGGKWRPNWKPARPARVLSSDLLAQSGDFEGDFSGSIRGFDAYRASSVTF